MQGVWRYEGTVPLERPKEFEGREFLTDEEIAQRETVEERHPEGCALVDMIAVQRAYASVQKLLERLERKTYVRSAREGAQRTFTAAVERERLIRRRLRAVADQLCEGSLTPLLVNLVQAGPLSEAEVRELQALLRQLRSDNSQKPR